RAGSVPTNQAARPCASQPICAARRRWQGPWQWHSAAVACISPRGLCGEYSARRQCHSERSEESVSEVGGSFASLRMTNGILEIELSYHRSVIAGAHLTLGDAGGGMPGQS